MGGQSSSTQTQQSTTAPWQAAQPALEGLLGQLNPLIANSGITGAQTGALNQIEQNAQGGNPYASAIGNTASNLLSGGGATAQSPAVAQAFQQYQANTSPLANNTDYNPYNTPGLKDALSTLTSDITNNTNGQFAAAGRDFSGANSMALGRGLTQGLAPALLGQYNQNVQNQQGAAGNLYNAANTTAGIQTGLNQQGLQNQLQGVQTANDALSAQNYAPNQILAAEAMRKGIPAQNLGLLAQIGIPIAGLGSQSTGQSQGTQQMSGAQQFATLAGGFKNLMGGLFG